MAIVGCRAHLTTRQNCISSTLHVFSTSHRAPTRAGIHTALACRWKEPL